MRFNKMGSAWQLLTGFARIQGYIFCVVSAAEISNPSLIIALSRMTSDIKLAVTLDADRMPEKIEWSAPGGGVPVAKEAKSFLLGIWDGADKAALRIDLWTKEMQVDEMGEFFYQSLMGMADTYARATRHTSLAEELKTFAQSFRDKAAEAATAQQ